MDRIEESGGGNDRPERMSKRSTPVARCAGTNEREMRKTDWKECPACSATGFARAGTCERCGGAGWKEFNETDKEVIRKMTVRIDRYAERHGVYWEK